MELRRVVRLLKLAIVLFGITLFLLSIWFIFDKPILNFIGGILGWGTFMLMLYIWNRLHVLCSAKLVGGGRLVLNGSDSLSDEYRLVLDAELSDLYLFDSFRIDVVKNTDV